MISWRVVSENGCLQVLAERIDDPDSGFVPYFAPKKKPLADLPLMEPWP